jgi:hypothetical protein
VTLCLFSVPVQQDILPMIISGGIDEIEGSGIGQQVIKTKV